MTAGSAAFVLLLAGCGTDDSGHSTDSGRTTATSSAAPAADAAESGTVGNAKASMFVIAYTNAFPELAGGRADGEIAELFTTVCGAIAEGENRDATVAEIVERTGSAATTDEADAIYTLAQYMC